MSILTISSTNPNLSFILQKNPNTIREGGKPFSRDIRKGKVYGWYTNKENTEFRLWFKDSDTESSFANGVQAEFEYLDITRYASPYLPLQIVQHALASAAKEQDPQDTAEFTTTVSTMIKIPSLHMAQQIAATAPEGSSIEIIEDAVVSPIKITAPTVFQALNLLQLLCVIMAIKDKDSYVQLDFASLQKFVRILNRSKASYYPRYLLSSRAINTRDVFAKLVSELQGENMTLKFGDTRIQRYDAIYPYLTRGTTLIDIGCGEMYYSFKKAPIYEQVYSVDCDEDLAEINQAKIQKRNIENIKYLAEKATPEWVESVRPIFESADVLMTEVLEHMPIEDADKLLRSVLSTDARRVVVTVPNGLFNENYAMGDAAFRHDDHHFEPTFQDWCDYTVTVAQECGWDVSNMQAGDIVNGESVSTLTVFTPKKKEQNV
ncbi:MAG TPA: class I SAM-dependent methyltransferase [Methanosarcina sp.]|nr:class I SAM-dependent methyltransferase [Methanosarcina sp.]